MYAFTHVCAHHSLIRRYENNYHDYIAHIIRGYHEIESKKNLFTTLPVGEVIEVSDWKMKVCEFCYAYFAMLPDSRRNHDTCIQFMMLVFRETMPDFFGKSGIPWVGTQFVVKAHEDADLQVSHNVHAFTLHTLHTLHACTLHHTT